jgi:hypothetical protein
MLQIYADLAHRAMRRDLLKPQILENENDFSEVERKRDGSLTVHNSRFKPEDAYSNEHAGTSHLILYDVVFHTPCYLS